MEVVGSSRLANPFLMAFTPPQAGILNPIEMEALGSSRLANLFLLAFTPPQAVILNPISYSVVFLTLPLFPIHATSASMGLN